MTKMNLRRQRIQKEDNQELKIEEIKKKELNDENIWKENKNVRKDYFCRTSPSLLKLIADQFNARQQQQGSQDIISDKNKAIDQILRFFLSSDLKEIENPQTNRCILLRNVSIIESPQEIVDTLEELGYEVEEVERFKGMPVVKVTFIKAEDVQRVIEEKVITIGFSEAKLKSSTNIDDVQD
ncbi:hypothetical protein RFI_36997 [Reticulomyxa filosa]|uniref:Uncharacterized protein n=1 Tax=Reticulomyxa filosa TaxID=46433 RepID=X6LH64_RETFI|nr:hypothetical protein RFI_36997 [Reticulomyxa filosa]|eukprot:ETO00447.1 hypothetical protein RFI_36997 [Reticulomyxa filosa]